MSIGDHVAARKASHTGTKTRSRRRLAGPVDANTYTRSISNAEVRKVINHQANEANKMAPKAIQYLVRMRLT